MASEPPAPPESLSDDLVESLEGCPPTALRDAAHYAERLADYREQNLEEGGPGERDRPEDAPGDTPEDVPSKATLTVKEINDNRYYYWQWREGDGVKSKYEGPVDAS
jgi:hypothetical protein